jgi:hypothetical protein
VSDAVEGVLPALARLDRRLQRALTCAAAVHGTTPDPYRGLYLAGADVERLLARAPGVPVLYTGDDDGVADEEASRFAILAREFALDAFDLDLVLLALAPEIDLRYERIYAYLQDDVTRRRPTLDLALDLLCATAEEKVARRDRCADGAPLIRHRLLHLVPDPHHVQPPRLAHYLALDGIVVRFVLGDDALDPRLRTVARLESPADVAGLAALAHPGAAALHALARDARDRAAPLLLYLQGRAPGAWRPAAAGVAAALGAPLLSVDLSRVNAAGDADGVLHATLAEARLRRAVPCFESADTLERAGRERLLAALAEYPGVAVLAGTRAWEPSASAPPVLIVYVPDAEPVERRTAWAAALAAHDIVLPPADVDALAARFRLDAAQIAGAAQAARSRARVRAAGAAGAPVVTRAECFAAARAQAGSELAALTERVELTETWDDLVLPADAAAQLREICDRVAHGPRVLHGWGFRRKLPLGTGVTVLFAGPSGTGKTMAARIIAGELGLDLHRIDLATVVSKYIGDTEKNLDRIFTAAESANAVLFFDEAESLFGRRSEVRDAHDRYANLEIAYLLQKMDAYEGIAILATNHREHLDDAFTRRLAFTVHFPFPDEASRRRIWAGIWPEATPRAADVDADVLARTYRLSGGHIRNAALAAAFLAAADGGVVTMAHVTAAVRREHQKLGKVVAEPAGPPASGAATR